MGHCHRLLSLCHAGTMLPAALTAPLGPPPHGYFYPPPNRASHCPILSGAVGALGTQCPAPRGPTLPRCPLTLPGHREPCPGRLEKVGWGAGWGLAGALAPWGGLGGTMPWGWVGSSGQMLHSAAGAAGRDACLGKKGVLEGCRHRAAGFGEGGRYLAGIAPCTKPTGPAMTPGRGERMQGRWGYPWARPQPKAETWGGSGRTLGTI